MNSTKNRKNRGFTLVELIVVVAILGVLMAVLVPQYIQYVEKARAGVCNSNCGTLQRQLKIALVYTGGEALSTDQISEEIGFTVKGSVLQNTDKEVCPSKGVVRISEENGSYIITCSLHGAGEKNFNQALEAAKEAAKNNLINSNDAYRKKYAQGLTTDFLADQSTLDLAKTPLLPKGTKYVVPYFIKSADGKGREPIMYVSNTSVLDDSTKTHWQAYMICFEGKWYQSTAVNAYTDQTNPGSMSEFTSSTYKEVKEMITNTGDGAKWKAVS